LLAIYYILAHMFIYKGLADRLSESAWIQDYNKYQ